MKNTLKFLAVVAVMSAFLTACGAKKTESTESVDTTAIAAPAMDTTQTAAPADTTAK